jgi:hypothetical protein
VLLVRLHKKASAPSHRRWARRLRLALTISALGLCLLCREARGDTQLTLSSSVTDWSWVRRQRQNVVEQVLRRCILHRASRFISRSPAKAKNVFLTYEGLDQQYASYPNLDRLFERHYVGLRDFESLSRQTYVQVDDSFLTGNAQAGVVVGAGELPLNSELIYSELFLARSAQNRFDLHLARELDEDTTCSVSMHQYVFSGGGSVTADQGISAEALRRIEGLLSGGIGYQYKYVTGLSGPLSESPDSTYHWPQAQIRYGGLGPILIQAGAGPIVQQSTAVRSGTPGAFRNRESTLATNYR